MRATWTSLLALAAVTVTSTTAVTPRAPSSTVTLRDYGRIPLRFEANEGQSDGQVKFLARTAGATLFLTPRESVLRVNSRFGSSPAGKVRDLRRGGPKRTASAKGQAMVLRMRLVGANPAPSVRGESRLKTVSHYFRGNDPRSWKTNVPNYARVRLSEVYPGIDVVHHGDNGQLEYDFIVAPERDPNTIRLAFPGSKSATIDSVTGDLLVDTGSGIVREKRPIAYQEIDSSRTPVTAEWSVAKASTSRAETECASFVLGSYDRSKPLVIDPILEFSTYLGGDDSDIARGIAVDGQGSAYITGETSSADFPLERPFQAEGGGDDQLDAFVSKLSPDGNSLVYSTYLSGDSDEGGAGIAVDNAGNAYVTGFTASDDFPVSNAFQNTNRNGDAFITKLSPGGNSLVYSTFLGGTSGEGAFGIAVDSAGSAYVTGGTDSIDFPTVTPIQALQGFLDVFVSKFSPAGNSLLYSTYLGGLVDDTGYSIAVDGDRNAYVTGFTASGEFPTFNAFQDTPNGGGSDAFVTKLAPTGRAFSFSTYLGGSGEDYTYGVAVDSERSVYVTGFTASSDFPTANAFQAAFGGGLSDAFVSKLLPTGSSLTYSSYLGGSTHDVGNGIAVDAEGFAHVIGNTDSTNFPTANAFQAEIGGKDNDAFVTKMAQTGLALAYSTYLGGETQDIGNAIALDASASAYVTGFATSGDFPTVDPFQEHEGEADAFITRLDAYRAPAGLTTTPQKDDIVLNWNDTSTGEQGFRIDRRPAGGKFTQLTLTPPNATSFRDVGAGTSSVAAKNFDYRIRAFGAQGHSPWVGSVTQGGLEIKKLKIDPKSIKGGKKSRGTVTLTDKAPEGGTVVALSSDTKVVLVPASVTVPEGKKSARFKITTQRVKEKVTATITANLGGFEKSATLKVKR